jgi:hypoxanthine phosphoribosyltransferase
MEKTYLSPNNMYLCSYLLAKKIEEDKSFNPDLIVGLWRGGTPVAITIHEYLKYKTKKEISHFPIKAESYLGVGSGNQSEIKTYQVIPFFNEFPKCKNVLFIDDIFDTGKTLDHLLNEVLEVKNVNIKLATLLYKPKQNQTKIKPDYYLFKTDKWIVFPHELDGLDEKIINENKFSNSLYLTHKEILNMNYDELKTKISEINFNF